MDKNRVAEVFEEIGILLELRGENPFKTRAYFSAARVLETLTDPLDRVVDEGRLGELKGIGAALQQKILELVTTGRLAYHEQLRQSVPPGLLELLTLPGLGPKKVKSLHQALGIDSVEGLETACRDGRVAGLTGFGVKTQAKILEGIAFRREAKSRHLLLEAVRASEPILESLREHPQVTRCSVAGSLRRWNETVAELDFVVSSRTPIPVIDHFVSQPQVAKLLARGDANASILLEGEMRADLRVVTDAEFPFALAHFTGSKEHNLALRRRADARGLQLTDRGLFRSTESTPDPASRVVCRTEEEIYHQLDLAYIPPELREDRGEFDAAEKDALPRLLEWTDLKGSLHNHSTWSDGHQSLEEIAAQACELGCAYWAITDHSRSSFVANGLDERRLRLQLKAIRAINDQYAADGSAFRLLTGSEVDILSDGGLDFSDAMLAELDVVVASVHQGFTQDEATMTRRLIRAAENPWVHMLGHLTGRLLLEREGYRVNQTAVIDACAACGTWIELNANPRRFDLDWRLWAYASSRGVRCVINCDSHRREQAGFLRLGAGIARKGWLTKADVINTQPLDELRSSLQIRRGSGLSEAD